MDVELSPPRKAALQPEREPRGGEMLFHSTIMLRGCCSGRWMGTSILWPRFSCPPPAPRPRFLPCQVKAGGEGEIGCWE